MDASDVAMEGWLRLVVGAIDAIQDLAPWLVDAREDWNEAATMGAGFGVIRIAGHRDPASPLPYADTVQRLFGRHDVSSIQAHTGGERSPKQAQVGRTYRCRLVRRQAWWPVRSRTLLRMP